MRGRPWKIVAAVLVVCAALVVVPRIVTARADRDRHAEAVLGIERYARLLDSTLPSGPESVGEVYDGLQAAPSTGCVYKVSVGGEERQDVWIDSSVASVQNLLEGASDCADVSDGPLLDPS